MKGMIYSVVVSFLAIVIIYACTNDERAQSKFPNPTRPIEWSSSTLPTWTPDPFRTPLSLSTLVPTTHVSADVATPAETADQALLSGPSNINIRVGPGTQYPVLQLLADQQPYRIIGQSNDRIWWQIVIESESHTGKTGWVYKDLVHATHVESVPTAEHILYVDPTPTVFPTRAPARLQVSSEELKEWRVDELSLRMIDNQLEFESSFKDKNLLVRGEVLSVRTEMSGTEVWIDLGGVNRGRGIPKVTCRMPIERRFQAMQIAKGDIIVVSGIGGEILITFDIEDCRILES